MDSDARIVRARIEIVSEQLHASRSRRSEVGSRAEDQAAIDAIAGFFDVVASRGWVHSFDAAIAALKALAAQCDGSTRVEVTGMVDHLAQVESSVLRLAAEAERAPQAHDSSSLFLRPSVEFPSVHANQIARKNPAGVRQIVEPGERRQLERTARDALDEVASLSLLRSPADDEAWAVGAGFERRMLECLDALAAYRRGPISVDVEAAALGIAKGYPVVDASRWFSAAFVVACTIGDRALASLREMVLTAPSHALQGVADALALGSNPGLDALSLSLVGEDDRPDILALALQTCLRRALLDTNAMVELLAHPSDAVASLAARCLARAEPKEVAHHLVPLFERPGVAVDAATTLLVFHAEAGARYLREAVARGFAAAPTEEESAIGRRAIGALALLGQKRDEETLLTILSKGAAPLHLLADHGASTFVPWLRTEMSNATSLTRAYEAASALERLTGILAVESEAPVEHPTFDPESYAARIAEESLPQADRIRFGHKLDLAAALAELANPRTLQGIRRSVCIQAAILRGGPLPLDVDGWISAQRLALRTLAATPKAAA